MSYGAQGRCWQGERPGYPAAMSDVTRILSAIEQGDPQAAEQLLPLVYDELRKLAAAEAGPGEARARRSRPRPWSTRPTCGWSDADQARHWNSRGHFFAAAAEAMRRILVENARRKQRRSTAATVARRRPRRRCPDRRGPPDDDLLALDEALTRLAAERPAARPSWSSCATSPA